MDTWDQGDSYERYMGRWSRLIARTFIDWLALPAGYDWLDVGCGTGALASAIAESAGPHRISGIDPSRAFIEAARRNLGEDPDLRVGDARDLPFVESEFDAAVSGLALNFVADPAAAVGEMGRVTRGGGAVAAFVWDYGEGMEMIRRFWDAALPLDPMVAHLDEASRFPLCREEALFHLFAESGLQQVRATGLVISTTFAGFDDYWRPFLGGQGPAPSYVASLDERHRVRLETRLRKGLPIEGDGNIHLTAKAWAVAGIV